jgi:sec-independent protein translocase protein TatA
MVGGQLSDLGARTRRCSAGRYAAWDTPDFPRPSGLTVPNIGPTELIIVLVIVLLIFGPKRLPGLGKQLGSGMREFKDSITGKGGRDEDEDDTRVRANAALGRPEDEPATATTPTTVDADVASDRPR